jgi:hypothetical protein
MSLLIEEMWHHPAKRIRRSPHPDIPYALQDFLDDQKRLLSSAHPGQSSQTFAIDDLDGRMLVIQLATSLDATRAGTPATDVFSKKYESGLAAQRLARFRLVLEFLEDSRAEISKAGLADGRDPLAVREEFVRYLLHWKTEPRQQRIPSRALSRFLDDWGHRWI